MMVMMMLAMKYKLQPVKMMMTTMKLMVTMMMRMTIIFLYLCRPNNLQFSGAYSHIYSCNLIHSQTICEFFILSEPQDKRSLVTLSFKCLLCIELTMSVTCTRRSISELVSFRFPISPTQNSIKIPWVKCSHCIKASNSSVFQPILLTCILPEILALNGEYSLQR